MADAEVPGDSPRWIREAIANALGELKLFFATARDFTLHPVRFSSAWIDGRQRSLNPLAFLATSAALLGGLRLLIKTAVRAPDQNVSLVTQILDALAPYLHYATLGLIAHLIFRFTGSRRPLRDSLAMALFSGGGPAAAADVLTTLVAAAFVLRHPGVHEAQGGWAVALVATPMLTFSVFSAALGSSLAAAHKAGQWWRTALAILVSYTATGVAFGLLQPHGNYGLHWVITFVRSSASGPWLPRIGLGL